jgi:ABC-type Fe3+ transport system permease subunit
MIFGGADKEQHRMKIGLVFLVVGVLLVLWAWGSWIYRTSNRTEGVAVAVDVTHDAPAEKVKAVRAAPMVLLSVTLVVLAFLVASYVLVRASRRYRMTLERRANPPTDTRDVWSMHKLKDFEDSDA